MKKNLSIILSVLMLFSVAPALASETLPADVLKVAVSANFAPFEYYDEKGQLAGFDIELMNYIGQELGYKIEYVDSEYEDILNTVISGKADCAISMLVPTKEKENVLDFSFPYFSVKRDYGWGITNYGYSIAVESGESLLLEDINEIITDIHDSGKISELLIDNGISEYAIDDPDYYTPTIYGGYRFVSITNPSDWAKDGIIHSFEIRLAESQKDYNYISPISREEFCDLIFRLIMLTKGSVTTVESENKFTDTDNTNITVLNQLGIINGKSDTVFAPNDNLTREEAATIIIRMIDNLMPMPATEMYFEYADKNEISDWADSAVQVISNLGFMLGVEDNKFAPKATYTTEQSLITLSRIFDRYDASREVYSYETPLGTITSKTDFNSHINFGIEANTRVLLVKDSSDFDGTRCIIPGPFKVIADQMASNYISFDDFAAIFGGEWSLSGDKFEFRYNPSNTVVPSAFTEKETSYYEWPNKTDAIPVLLFSDTSAFISVNGKDMRIRTQSSGKIIDAHIMMYNNKLYIPVYMVAKLMGYDYAAPDILWD